MTVELARSCAPYVTTIVNNADIVPTISPGASAVAQFSQAVELDIRMWLSRQAHVRRPAPGLCA